VLVDEGISASQQRRGTGQIQGVCATIWRLPNAFLFEYSATTTACRRHVEEYGEQIVYDYNYYRFFKDGYGKDFSVARIADDAFDAGRECWENFTTAFRTLADKLAVYQELRVNLATGAEGLQFTGFFPDKPLLAFMGRTVEDSKDEGKSDEVSDIRKLLGFLARLTFEEKQELQEVFGGQIAGPLTLTVPGVTDEILSPGDGEYWGSSTSAMATSFSTTQGSSRPEGADAHAGPVRGPIIESPSHFSQLHGGQPITVLIAAGKFARWNCFRLSSSVWSISAPPRGTRSSRFSVVGCGSKG